jgi:carbamoyltransferase
MRSSHRAVTIGIGGVLGHDANAALMVDGNLIASAQEERYTRVKHDGRFPESAIADCLARAGLVSADVTDVVFAEKPLQSSLFNLTGRPGGFLARTIGLLVPERVGGLWQQIARHQFPAAAFHYAWHHLSHVAGAFHTSPFERAAFLCVDGKGEDYSASAGVIDGGEIKMLFEQPYENGLGLLYTLVTHHLGFASFGSEYKVMGLAPYGRPTLTAKLAQLYNTDERGGLRLRVPVSFKHQSMVAAVALVTEATGIQARAKSDLLTQAHVDLAASLQKIFEEEVLKMARYVRAETGEDALLFCGGCAQNCVAAGRLRAERVFPRLFNSPVGGDMGSAFGAVLVHERTRRPRELVRVNAHGFYLGSEPGPPPAEATAWRVEVPKGGLHAFVAARLQEGKTVGWVRGRMELGARALGARSILADPRQPGMQSRLNLAVKFRESFRPFAPAILAEEAGAWFDSADESDYMNYTANLLPSRRKAMPDTLTDLKARLDFPRSDIQSVVHVDFSARLQTVRREVHPDFHRLISEFHALTGVPVVINTSFNVGGQPIVRTAVEAWECFLHTDLDLLVLNDEVFRNPAQKTREEKLTWLGQFAKSF